MIRSLMDCVMRLALTFFMKACRVKGAFTGLGAALSCVVRQSAAASAVSLPLTPLCALTCRKVMVPLADCSCVSICSISVAMSCVVGGGEESARSVDSQSV